MAKKKIINDTEALKDAILSGMLEKKGVDIVVMDLRNIKNVLSDYFIICTGTSDSHVDSISDSVLEEVHLKLNQNPRRKEGKKNREWILLDYLDIIVHVFKKDKREFYGLEQLWGDATVELINPETNQAEPFPLKKKKISTKPSKEKKVI
ncbi:MAG: ribosome silencing factor [Cytophagales bacterium]|nr:ribosome silencing factor [Cytophagales bacterium]